MKSLLFALGLALCCFVQADEDQRFENVDHTLLLPKGFVVAIITNCPKMEKMASNMTAFSVSFEKVSENEVQMTMEMAMKEGCKTIKMMLEREDGVFIVKCRHGGKKIVEYIRINGKESMFVIVEFSNKKGKCKVATLIVTDLAYTQALLDPFKAFAYRQGLEGVKSYVLPTEGMCPYSS